MARVRWLGALAVVAALAWSLWPRPALRLQVDLGGRAWVVGRFGQREALPETVLVAARGRNTRIRLENRDTVTQTLGLFSAGPGATREYRVPLPGTYGGFCSAHESSGTITYIVR